jgi:DNA polymerase-3 subunit delta
MQLSPEQLPRQLERGLAPCYLLSGDEALLINESADQVRAAALKAGYSEHTRWTVEAGFDWNVLNTSTQSLSLFAERRLIELRLPTGKPGDAGSEFISSFAENPPADTVLLVLTGKLDKSQRESAWVRMLEQSGTHVQARALEARQLPAWITQRLQSRGLKPEAGVVDILAWHLEGNLLAAAQEVDKLAMRVGSGSVTRADVEQCLADNSRFTIYQWVDAALAGNAAGASRMLTSLRADGTEPILLLWALARELHSLAPMAAKRARGQNEAAVLASVWQSRRALVGAALKRHSAAAWMGFVRRAARCDRILKGRARGDVWLELERLILSIAGAKGLPGDAELLEKSA